SVRTFGSEFVTAGVGSPVHPRAGRRRTSPRLTRRLIAERCLALGVGRLAVEALDALDTGQPLAVAEPDEAHALGITPDDGHLVDRRAHERAARADEHELLSRRDLERRDHGAVALARLLRDDTLAAATMAWELIERGELPVAVLRGGEDETVADDDESDELLSLAESHPAYPGCIAAHRAHLLLVEADRLAATRAEDDLPLSVGERDADEPVIVVQIDCDDAACARPRERGERRLLHRALFGGHEDEVLLIEALHRQNRVDLLAFLERQEIHHRPPARAAAGERELVDLQPVDLPAVGEAKHRVVSVRDEELLDEILVLDRGRRAAPPSPPLRLVLRDGLRFRIARVRERDHHVLRLDEVLGGEREMSEADLGAARIAERLAHVDELRAHDLRQPFGPRENVAKIANGLEERLVLLDDLLLLEPGQAMQAHVEDRLRLLLREPIAPRHQSALPGCPVRPCRVRRGCRLDLTGAREQLRHDAGRPDAREQRRPRLRGRRRGADERDDIVEI